MDEYKELHYLILKLENNNNANKDNIIIFNKKVKHKMSHLNKY